MGSKKKYSTTVDYEAKLKRVMERLGIAETGYDFSKGRYDCSIDFTFEGNRYRFFHSLEKAKELGIDTIYVSDLFAILVLSLEDLARMNEKGAYKLSTWLEGMKQLPAAKKLDACFIALNFTSMPATSKEVVNRYRVLAKVLHPDTGGSTEAFQSLTTNYEQCMQLMEPKETT